MTRPAFALALLLLAGTANGQDGGQLYTLYCSACHGADGKGATGGQFPPLASSPWVAGEADRMIKVVLHGLHGPVEVAGTTYNLEMPPQGAVLPDEQIAAIATFVRSSWGNAGGRVEAAEVQALRAATADRVVPWTPEEILKLHPLPLEKTALSGLISRTYSGNWEWLPEFADLEPVNVEEEHDGLLDVSDAPLKDHFAIVWQGEFTAPAEGIHEFLLDADDAAALRIDGKTVAEVGGEGPMNGSRAKSGRIALTQGSHPIQVEYLEIAGREGIALGWKGPGTDDKGWHWLSKRPAARARNRDPISIEPAGSRPVIYRNFIDGTTPRAIGVGFPGGVNLAYSADHLAPELVWTGAFIDGAYKWQERGTETSPPAGENVVILGNSRALPPDARFRGYELDADGNPTFVVTLGDIAIKDAYRASNGTLVRTLRTSGNGESVEIEFAPKAAELATGNPSPAQLVHLSEHLDVLVEPAAIDQPQRSPRPLRITLTPGRTVTLTYRWR